MQTGERSFLEPFGGSRRPVLFTIWAALMTGLAVTNLAVASSTAGEASAVQAETSSTDLAAWETSHRAHVGIAVTTASGEMLFEHRADERFPLTSTFKSLICARMWSLGRKDEEAKVKTGGLVDYAPVYSKLFPEKAVTLDHACRTTLRTSDNRAANLVLRATGGPKAVTAWFRSLGDTVTRIDRYEPELNDWAPGGELDTTTPRAATELWRTMDRTIEEPARGKWLSALEASEVSTTLLKVEPALKGWRIADRTGSGHNTRALHARVESPAGNVYYVAVHLAFDRKPGMLLKEKDAHLRTHLHRVASVLTRVEVKRHGS